MPKTTPYTNLPGSKYLSIARPTTAATWRTQLNQTHLVSQASSILLQRHPKFWAPLLNSLNLSSYLTPSLFLQILHKIQTHPKTCLSFFNWAKKTLHFKPDLKAHCHLTRILFGSGLSDLGKPILDSVIRDHPASKIVPLLVQSRKSLDFECVSLVLSSVIEYYCSKDMFLEGLEGYKVGLRYGVGLNSASCNALLDLLVDRNELRLGWCCFGSMMRHGFVGNGFKWSVIAKILDKDGKFERVSVIFGMGLHDHLVFDIMIEGYSRRGDFESAFHYLDEMCSKGIEPGFSTYSSILDGGCKYRDGVVIEKVMCCMVEKGFLMERVDGDFDLMIRKLSSLGRTYAVDLFYKRACDEGIELSHATYGGMLKTFYEGGRVKDAIDLYYIMLGNNVSIDKSCCNEFLMVLCKENPSLEVTKLLVEIIGGGFCSVSMEISEYIRKMCQEGRWREAEELFNVVVEHGVLLDSLAYGSFVKRYCSRRQIDRAILLHNKLEELKVALDLGAYNVLLCALFKEKRIEEAMTVFDYMKACKMLRCESFEVMIKGLCHEKELRKAMKLHDEMLEMGLKPDPKVYKKLISGFK